MATSAETSVVTWSKEGRETEDIQKLNSSVGKDILYFCVFIGQGKSEIGPNFSGEKYNLSVRILIEKTKMV